MARSRRCLIGIRLGQIAGLVAAAFITSAIARVPLPAPRPPAGISRNDPPAETPRRVTRAEIRSLVEQEALKAGLPADIAEAVVKVESSFDPATIGSVGEIGLMQVRPGTAAMMGFRGSADELARPEVNIHYGVTYLAKAWRLAGGDLCRALMKYRAGHGEEIMSALSVTYCNRARSHLATLGSPFAGAGVVVPVDENARVALAPAAPHNKVSSGLRRGTAAASRAFWAAHEARVHAITARLRARWGRVASR